MLRSFLSSSRPQGLFPALSWVLVCVLVCLEAAPARAQDSSRTVAIVNLSPADDAAAVAARARDILAKAPGLRPTENGDLARNLERTLPKGGPDAPVLARAQGALDESDQAFGQFKSKLAVSKLDEARRSLFSIAPSPDTTRLLADLSFRMALIHLRANNIGLAMGEFELHHRLAPESKIDPVRFPPGVVKAFKDARRRSPTRASATFSVTATYDGAPVFLDGAPAGKAPLSIPVTAGVHIVSIAAPQYESAARKVDIDPGDTQAIRFDLQPRSPVTRALELRFLAQERGFDDASLEAAAAHVSRLVGSDAVLIITGENSEATLYIQELARLSYRSKVDSKLTRMLALALPVPRPPLVDGVTNPGPVPWYLHPIGLAALATGASLAIVGVLSVSTGSNGIPERMLRPVWDF